MQSDEDFSNPDVQEKLKIKFNELKSKLNSSRHPRLMNIVTDEIEKSKMLNHVSGMED